MSRMSFLGERGLSNRLGELARLTIPSDSDTYHSGSFEYRGRIGFYVGDCAVENGDYIEFVGPKGKFDGKKIRVRFSHDGLIE